MWCRVTARLARPLRVAFALALTAVFLTALQVAAPSARAVPGLETPRATSNLDSAPRKSATARCSSTSKHVISGGAAIDDGKRRQLRLVGLIPQTASGVPDTYTAWAEAPNLTRSFDWKVTAFAICADRDALANYQIITAFDDTDRLVRSGGVECFPTPGTVSFGGGALLVSSTNPAPSTSFAEGKIGLQSIRTSNSLGGSRVWARTDADFAPRPWRLVSYAICVQTEQSRSLSIDAWVVRQGAQASVDCTGFTLQVHGMGGGAESTGAGPVWLQKLQPRAALLGIDVAMTGAPNLGMFIAPVCTVQNPP